MPIKATLFLIFFFLQLYINGTTQNHLADFFSDKTAEEIVNWQKQVGDVWFNQHVDSSLKVGDQMPDLKFGSVINNLPGKNRFYDLKGKLIILDFWSTGCTSCIAAFPKMLKLQRHFGDSIQVILVNPWETKDQILQRFKSMKKVQMPHLPCITGPNENIQKYFPGRNVPYHVWIDQNAKVSLIGASYNTYIEKIRMALRGQKVSFIRSYSTNTPFFNKDKSYAKMMGKSIDKLSYNFYITPYNNFYNAIASTQITDRVDSSDKTIRSTYINTDIVNLFLAAFNDELKINLRTTIYAPFLSFSSNTLYDYLILNVRDSLQLTSFFHSINERGLNLKDTERIKSQYCYEQIVPWEMSKHQRLSHMVSDLNNSFDSLYGVSGSVRSETIVCYVLVRTSHQDKISQNRRTDLSMNSRKDSITLNSSDIRYLFQQAISSNLIPSSLFRDSLSGKSLYLLNDTGFEAISMTNGKISKEYKLTFPMDGSLHSMQDLKRFLQRYGLDIVKKERQLNFLYLTDKLEGVRKDKNILITN